MKTLVIYDSNFGNTEIIAKAISKGLGEGSNIVSVEKYYKGLLEDVELLVVGCPIVGWKPSERMGHFLSSLTESEIKDIKVSTFDTRVKVFFHGDACKKILERLVSLGGIMTSGAEGFYVKGKDGPLLEGEEQRAVEWGEKLRGFIS
jgi:flavodoxin